MDQCCANFTQNKCGTHRKDSLFECFEENLKLKTFYQLLRSTKPRPCKKPAMNLGDSKCFCERKRALQAEEIKKRNELSEQRELLLLQCMCASIEPLRQKLEQSKNNKEEVKNLKDCILKECLFAAIEIILETKRKIALEKKRNLLRAKFNKRQLQFKPSAERGALKSEMVDIEKCCRHYAIAAARQYHKKMLGSQNQSSSSICSDNSVQRKRSLPCKTSCNNKADKSCEKEISNRKSRDRSKKITPTSIKRTSSNMNSQCGKDDKNERKRTAFQCALNYSRTSCKSSSSCEPKSSPLQSRDRSRRKTSTCSRQSSQCPNLKECTSMCRCMCCKKAPKKKSKRKSALCPIKNYRSDSSCESNSSRYQGRIRSMKRSKPIHLDTRCPRTQSKKPKRTGTSSSCEPNSSRHQSRDASKKCTPKSSRQSIPDPKLQECMSKCCKKNQKENRKWAGCFRRNSKSEASDGRTNSRDNSNSSKKCSSKSSRQSSPDLQLRECASICAFKCCEEARRRKRKRAGCSPSKSENTPNKSILPNPKRNSVDRFNKQPIPQLCGGCDYQSSTSCDRRRSSASKKKSKSSASTDTMSSTRFRGRWFFRGKDTFVHQNFLPPRSSMKSPKRSKTFDDKKRLRFNSKSSHGRDSSILTRNFIPSSDCSTVEKMQQTYNLVRQTDHSKSPPSNDRLKAISPSDRSSKLKRSYDWLREMKRKLRRNRQKGGETTDTDQKSKRKKRISPMAIDLCCVPSSAESTSLDGCEEIKTEGRDTTKNTLMQFLPECKSSDQTKELHSSEALHEMKTNNANEISCQSLMSDLSLTKVYTDLLMMLRPDLLSENDNEQSSKKMRKKRKVSVRIRPTKDTDLKKSCNVPSSIKLYLLSPPHEPPKISKRRRRTCRSNRKRAQPMNCKKKQEYRFPSFRNGLCKKKSSNKPRCTSQISQRGCSFSCGNRKVRVNYLDPERWACLKNNLKIPKHPKPLPEDFILDTRVQFPDAEVERCRKEKRERQLSQWKEDLQREKMQSDPFYCPEMQTPSAGEKPGSELYYVCRPVKSGSSNGGACVYECCFCPNPQSLGNKWKEVNPKFVINCKENLSVPANVQQNINCTPSVPFSSSSEERIKSAQGKNGDNCRSDSKSSGERRTEQTEEGDKKNLSSDGKENHPKSPQIKKVKMELSPQSRESDGKRPHPKSSQKLQSTETKSDLKPQTKRIRTNTSQSSSSRSLTPIKNQKGEKNPTSKPLNISEQKPNECEVPNKNCQCDCEACRKTALKINVDRQRMEGFRPRTQYNNEHKLMQNATGCTCSLCNNGCCVFNTIEKHFLACRDITPKDNSGFQELGLDRCNASLSSSCSNQINQRDSWCCTEDFLLITKNPDSDTENNYDMDTPHCSNRVNQNLRLNLVRDNCYKWPKCTESADQIDSAPKKKCLFLWVPKCTEDGESPVDPVESNRNANISTEDGTFFQVVKVKSDELGFLTQDRQAGGSSGKHMPLSSEHSKSTKKQKRTNYSKSVKKQVFRYRVKCQQEEPYQKTENESNTKELLVTACQLQSKKSSTPGPVKVKICESMRPKEENNLSKCSSYKKALNTKSVPRK